MKEDVRSAEPRTSLRRYGWIIAVAIVAIGGGSVALAWRAESPTSRTGTTVASASGPGTAWVRRETRPTLEPARFVGKAAETHRTAREIPDLLDHMYCYCECDKTIGHKSLLSCYTDGHAAT